MIPQFFFIVDMAVHGSDTAENGTHAAVNGSDAAVDGSYAAATDSLSFTGGTGVNQKLNSGLT